MTYRAALARPRVYVSVVVGIILLAATALIAWKVLRPKSLSQCGPVETALGPQPKFKDITQAANIDFTHVNGYTTIDKKLLPEIMGGGVAFLDYDHSGRQSILFVNSCYWPGTEPSGKPRPTMKLYHNEGNGKFKDVTEITGLNEISFYGMGVTVGDYNNSGYPSIFISGVGDHRLLRNESGKRFVDVTKDAGDLANRGGWPERPMLPDNDFYKYKEPIRFESSCTWVDYDGDGLLDLFVCVYVSWSPADDLAIKNDPYGVRIYPGPKQYPATQCFLYHNEGGGKFKDVSKDANIHVLERGKVLGKSLGVAACDFDDEGLPSLLVANDSVRNFYFHNKGDGTFEEVGVRSGFSFGKGPARGGMGIDIAEYRPGLFGSLICNFTKEPNSFLCYDKKTKSFDDTADRLGLGTPSFPWVKFGCCFFDYDLSGRLGLINNDGNLDADLAPKENEDYRQKPQLYWNAGYDEKLQFVPVGAKDVGDDLFLPLVGRGCAVADIDGRGYPSIVLMDCGGKARLIHNEGGLGNHWVRFELEGDGVLSNKSAIGAWIELKSGELVQRRYVVAGRGYLSQSELPVTFGLGKEMKIDSVTIRWPGKNAKEKTVIDGKNIDVDRSYRVRQQGNSIEEVNGTK
jgi:hypothetical protein